MWIHGVVQIVRGLLLALVPWVPSRVTAFELSCTEWYYSWLLSQFHQFSPTDHNSTIALYHPPLIYVWYPWSGSTFSQPSFLSLERCLWPGTWMATEQGNLVCAYVSFIPSGTIPVWGDDTASYISLLLAGGADPFTDGCTTRVLPHCSGYRLPGAVAPSKCHLHYTFAVQFLLYSVSNTSKQPFESQWKCQYTQHQTWAITKTCCERETR